MQRVHIVLFHAVAVIYCCLLASSSPDFACQSTIDTYNQYVNVGQFEKAANLTFTDSVIYIIPGPMSPSGLCPYCGVYNGKKEVVSLFVDGFLGHFTIVNPLINLRQIDTGATLLEPRLMNFNQESFVTKPEKTKGGIGRYFSVPVIHDFSFESVTCKIKQMILFQDSLTVTKVFAGLPATTAPIMPFCLFASPPSTFSSQQNVSDFQVFPFEEAVSSNDARGVVTSYYMMVKNGNGTLSPAAAQLLFMPLDYSIPQALAAMIVPGDPSAIGFAGMYMGIEQIVQAHQLRASMVAEAPPLKSQEGGGSVEFIVDGGSVSVKYRLRGVAKGTGKSYECDAVDYFQVFPATSDGKFRIGRLTRFFDTYNISVALR